jgi:hypothetical protein
MMAPGDGSKEYLYYKYIGRAGICMARANPNRIVGKQLKWLQCQKFILALLTMTNDDLYIGEFVCIGNVQAAEDWFGIQTIGWHKWNEYLNQYEPYYGDFKND